MSVQAHYLDALKDELAAMMQGLIRSILTDMRVASNPPSKESPTKEPSQGV